MILSAQSIRKRGIFNPFHERTVSNGMTYGLSPAGYDVRVAEDVRVQRFSGYFLASTLEHFNMPNDVLGKVVDKSTWARRFIFVQNTVIEPGWHGFLTLEITNHGPESVFIKAGTPIAQIILQLLDEPTEQPYAGKYQGQRAGAVNAILEGVP